MSCAFWSAIVTGPSLIGKSSDRLGPEYGNEVEYLRVVVKQLRRKIEPTPANPRYLLTEPCVGYCFTTTWRSESQTPDAAFMNF